ncbi:MAG: diacylglycerol kinase family lipid kinase [Acidobacteria bacterium]|nr:diacylglycerol kinase family lipid kinase [Acidobacteriota bacterium]
MKVLHGVLIYNPRSGGWRSQRIGQVCNHLLECGVKTDLRITSGPGDATRLARQAVREGCELIIACGGDGTVNEVVCGLAGSPIPLGLIPCGTGNVLALELGIPRDPLRAAEVIRRGTPLDVTLGKAGERCFLLMAGIGVDGSIVQHLSPSLKRRFGIASFWMEGLRHLLTYRLKPFEISVNGNSYTATFAVIGNAHCYGGGLLITPQASLTEEALDVCLIESRSKLDFVKYLIASFRGAHLRYPGVRYMKAKKAIRATGDEDLLVQVDGEVAGRLPMEFTLVPRGLRLLVPAQFASEKGRSPS